MQKQQHTLEGSINDSKADNAARARDEAMKKAPPPAPHWPFPIRKPAEGPEAESSLPEEKPQARSSLRRAALVSRPVRRGWNSRF